jgi:triacylglycerol esterase/lipase EstA (alpha/beta hydrolase family)
MLRMNNGLLQRLIVVSSLAVGCALALWLWPKQPAWALICAIAPIMLITLILAIQCVWAAIVNHSDSSIQPARFAQWLGAWFAEWKAALKVFVWWQPFCQQAIADNLQASPGRRGIVLVHGFFCNRALWTDWMKELHAQKRVFVAVDLAPAFGSISEYADVIEAAIAQVERATGITPVIIGHSMGGLAIRAWAAKYASLRQGLQRIHHIFTVGTPHHGTAIAAASHTLNGTEMRRESAWLADNALRLPDDFAKSCTCYFSHCDNIVFPASSATLAGADNRHIAGHAHVHLLFAKEIQQAVLNRLEN